MGKIWPDRYRDIALANSTRVCESAHASTTYPRATPKTLANEAPLGADRSGSGCQHCRACLTGKLVTVLATSSASCPAPSFMLRVTAMSLAAAVTLAACGGTATDSRPDQPATTSAPNATTTTPPAMATSTEADTAAAVSAEDCEPKAASGRRLTDGEWGLLSAVLSDENRQASREGITGRVQGFFSWCDLRDHPEYSTVYWLIADDVGGWIEKALFICEQDDETGVWTCDDSTTTSTTNTTVAAAATTTEPTTTTEAATATPSVTTTTELPCTFETAIARALPSVVQIVTDQGTGTAFYFDTHWLVTAAHVVVDAAHVTIRSGARDIPVELDAWDTLLDVAFLYAPGQAGEPIPWAYDTDLQPGTELAIIGYPTGVTGSASVTDGRLSRIVQHPGDITFLQTNAAANPGNSGGPVINKCGEVVGMVISKLVSLDVEGIAYAVGTTTLQYMNDFAALNEADPPAIFDWMIEDATCMNAEEKDWLRSVVYQLNRLAMVDEGFLEVWNQAAEEEGTLVENDPTWLQAAMALSYRYEAPALELLGLFPAPTAALRDDDHLLRTVGESLAEFGGDMPWILGTWPVDFDAANSTLELLEDAAEAITDWTDVIAQYC